MIREIPDDRGRRRHVLLSGVALNWFGAAKLAREVWRAQRQPNAPSDYEQLKFFTAGTAATFGAFYLYLHTARKPAVPLLMFGAALKVWAFVASAILLATGRLDRERFLSFGVTNGLVGALFWVEIVREARASDRNTIERSQCSSARQQ